ncbi:MAG: hypothetical protein D6713_09715 [Deltaproteobacteria bacterium]|nr:MAG: hypothetical protein D6713_09715 [Deltaproteobacteria bacterium]
MRERIERFAGRVRDAGGSVHGVPDEGSLAQVLREILPEGAAVFVPKVTDLERGLSLDWVRSVEDPKDAAVTVEEVEFGIAETGTVVVTGRDDRPVTGSLLAERHVAILPEERVVETMEEVFRTLGEDPPANVTFITGPSRTADIELTLTIGVHGPSALDVVLVGENSAAISGLGNMGEKGEERVSKGEKYTQEEVSHEDEK